MIVAVGALICFRDEYKPSLGAKGHKCKLQHFLASGWIHSLGLRTPKDDNPFAF